MFLISVGYVAGMCMSQFVNSCRDTCHLSGLHWMSRLMAKNGVAHNKRIESGGVDTRSAGREWTGFCPASCVKMLSPPGARISGGFSWGISGICLHSNPNIS